MACDVQTIATNARADVCALGRKALDLSLLCVINGGSPIPHPPAPDKSYLLRDDGDYILLDDSSLIEINL